MFQRWSLRKPLDTLMGRTMAKKNEGIINVGLTIRVLHPTALNTAQTHWNSGHSECTRVNKTVLILGGLAGLFCIIYTRVLRHLDSLVIIKLSKILTVQSAEYF